MRVIIWSINYAPEQTGIAVPNRLLARELKRLGHEPVVVTTFPYYPSWRKRPEDQGKWYQTSVVEDVPVHRCWHYVPKQITAFRRILHEVSFVCTSFLRILFLKRSELLLVVSPPLGLGIAAPIVRFLKGGHLVLHVHNLQPDAAIELKMLKSGRFTDALLALERFSYTKADQISSTSDGILQRIRKKGVPQQKTVYFPNPSPFESEVDLPPAGRFREMHRIPEGVFLAIYSGSLGVKQGLDVLLDAAEILEAEQGESPQKVQLVICGDGGQCEELEKLAYSRWITSILFLPLQPEAEYLEMLRDSDCYLITQQHGAGGFCVPTKLLPALACGKAILSVADEESELVTDALAGEFGSIVAPRDGRGLAQELVRLAANPEEVRVKGRKALEYSKRFEAKKIVEAFIRECEQAMPQGGGHDSSIEDKLVVRHASK